VRPPEVCRGATGGTGATEPMLDMSWLSSPRAEALMGAFPESSAPPGRTLGGLTTTKRGALLADDTPELAGPIRASEPPVYFNRFRTDCGNALACASIAVPACCRIWARVRLAVSSA